MFRITCWLTLEAWDVQDSVSENTSILNPVLSCRVQEMSGKSEGFFASQEERSHDIMQDCEYDGLIQPSVSPSSARYSALNGSSSYLNHRISDQPGKLTRSLYMLSGNNTENPDVTVDVFVQSSTVLRLVSGHMPSLSLGRTIRW